MCIKTGWTFSVLSSFFISYHFCTTVSVGSVLEDGRAPMLTLLVATGYLKATNPTVVTNDVRLLCEVSIADKEIASVW